MMLGNEHNRKITTELDLFLAEQILRLRTTSCPKHTGSIAKKHFAVLGGFGGIGAAVCELLIDEGAIVTKLSRKTGLDLTKPATIVKAFKCLGPIDGLINCAGDLKVKPLQMHTLQEIQELIQVNFTGLVMACRQAQIRQGGHIINLASSAYTRGRKNYGIYSAAKAAVINFTQSLAEENPQLHIHAVIPQRTNTAMRTSNFPEEDINLLLEPKDVATATLQLLKDSLHTGLLVDVKKALPSTKALCYDSLC
ncbi:MAG: SDR family oxidoreductase [Chlamydiae bacterium]|nr:SDR family oxidoreductase [Chlamydiota bacterium]